MGPPFNMEHLPVLLKMVAYIEGTEGQSEGVAFLKSKVSCGAERIEAWGRLEDWLEIYSGVFTVNWDPGTLTQQAKALRLEWAEAKQLRESIATRDIAALRRPKTSPPTETPFPINEWRPWKFWFPEYQCFTDDSWDNGIYKKKIRDHYAYGGCTTGNACLFFHTGWDLHFRNPKSLPGKHWKSIFQAGAVAK